MSGIAETREQAAEGLGELIDVTSEQTLKEFASDGGVREAVLTALRGVIKHSGKSVSSAVRFRLCTLLKDFIQADVDEVRVSAAKVVGTMSKYLEYSEVNLLLQTLSSLSTSPNWNNRHGAVLTLSSMSLHAPSMICRSSLFPDILDHLKSSLRDDKFPVRESATKALGRILYYEAKNEEQKSANDLLRLLIVALQDDSSEVQRRSLSSIKAAAKVNLSMVISSISSLGPAIAERLKDGNISVRLAAERCALHVFSLTKGISYLTISLVEHHIWCCATIYTYYEKLSFKFLVVFASSCPPFVLNL
ncbi:hypothetical protein KSP40_PGU011431 [Platanthera guangdongensis]|uniref:Clathrin/coatomer adaptor adaptin-like N-terminal domain-containing protein n=1 Tax=Platanthera guangdongensis TaxID=2320717 RepID=A0ABR2MT44_9ASPA